MWSTEEDGKEKDRVKDAGKDDVHDIENMETTHASETNNVAVSG